MDLVHSDNNHDCLYVAITNIPGNFHTADLRAFFSTLVESKSFLCFHFRHRPEKHESGDTKTRKNSKKCCCVVKLKSLCLDLLIEKNNQHWCNQNGDYLSSLCKIDVIELKNEDNNDSDICVDENILTKMAELNPPELMPNGNVGTPTSVFLELIHKCLLPTSIIRKLNLKFPGTSAQRIYSNVDFNYDYDFDNKYRKKDMSCSLTEKLIENRRKINRFKNTKHIRYTQTQSSDSDSHCTVTNVLYSPECSPSRNVSTEKYSDKDQAVKNRLLRKQRKRQEKALTKKLMNEGIEEKMIKLDKKYRDDSDSEEWDIAESREDDIANQGRNKERLYEEEIEQVWEKGGPGVVFYTDAQYWQEKEGDFDEQTADDLDVDFSAYDNNGSGDKDINDFLKIRKEKRFRDGIDKTDMFSIGIGKPRPNLSKIGSFEAHTKGIGRKVLEKQGWTSGQGLGVSKSGIPEPIKSNGQNQGNKSGLGYVEEKLVNYAELTSKKKARERLSKTMIATSYDDPTIVDPHEPLLRRNEPTILKHRIEHVQKFCKSS